MPKFARMGKFLSLTMLITVFFCDNFFFLTDFCIFQQKKILSQKKSYHFSFFLKEIVISELRKAKKCKESHTYAYFGFNFDIFLFFFRALFWQKKVINLIKVCETYFQIRLVESQKNTIK